MSNITQVTLTSGLGTAGTGTMSTLDNLIGTAGSASAQVQTIQGVASMTPISIASSGTAITNTTGALDINVKSGGITTGTQASPSASYLSTVAAGDIAAGSSDSGNPLKMGGVASSATPTKVSASQRVAAWLGLRGEIVAVGATRENKGKQHTTITSSTSETTVVTAVASTFLDLYGLVLSNTSATATNVTLRDGTGGTVIGIYAVPANDIRGFILSVDSAVPQGTVNTNWTVQSSQSISSLEVTAFYVKNT